MLHTDAPPRREVHVFLLVSLFLILLVAAGSMDARLGAAAARAPRDFVRIGLVVTDFGKSAYMFAIAAAVGVAALSARDSAWGRARRLQLTLIAERALYFFTALGAAGMLAELIKYVVGRARPKLLPQFGAFHFDPFSFPDVLESFPSRHTTNVFAAAVALSFMFPRARVVWFVIAAMIAASRILVGAHYPSDVVGGAALGATVAYLIAHVFARRGIAFDATSSTLRIKQTELRLGGSDSAATDLR